MIEKEIFVDNPFQQPPIVEIENGWIAHVNCEGARWHVLSWSSSGVHCSEARCIKNKSRLYQLSNREAILMLGAQL